MKQFFPIIQWLGNYRKSWLSGDLSAGLTVGVMLIPQGMAYAMLAGLPAIYGLYAATVPLFLYAIFGTSRQLAVGPVAMVALLISSGVGALADFGTETFVAFAILLSLMVGVLQFAMGVFRMGFLANFLSHPVISGFTSAAAIYIAISQLKHLLGLEIERGNVYHTLQGVFSQLNEINWVTLAIGLGAILLIFGLKKWNRKIPFPLIAVIIGLALGFFLELNSAYNVAIIEDVPEGLPAFQVPDVNQTAITTLWPIALTIALIGFTETIAIAKAIQKRHKNYEVDPNQELVALGLANIGGAFFQAFPTTGGFARSAVNDQAGAKTGLASLISVAIVILTLLFLTDYFYHLPKAVLAAIIMTAVFNLVDVKEAKHLWKTDRRDFLMFILTALATLILGVENGIIAGVLLSIGALLIRVSYPHIAELGMDEKSRAFLNVDRFEHIDAPKQVLIVRLDAQLFFANTRFFQDRLKTLEENKTDLKAVILDARGINGMDSTAVHALDDIITDYQKRNIKFYMTNVKGPIRDILRRTRLRAKIGEKNFFLSIEDALAYMNTHQRKDDLNLTLQTNEE